MPDVSAKIKGLNIEFNDNLTTSPNIDSGDDIKTSFARIHKRFSQMKSAAYIDASISNNKTITLGDSSIGVVSISQNQGLTDIEKTNARTNIGAGTSNFNGSFNSLTDKPTTISGYGITDAFSGSFTDLTNKPTTLSGYGITDAYISGGTITLGNDSITPGTSNFSGAFADLTGKPTTLSGYGITDANITSGVITLGNDTITPITKLKTFVCTCSTAASTPNKQLVADSDFELVKGVTIIVRNTYTNSIQNVTLNVNNSGARQIYYNGEVITSVSSTVTGTANRDTVYVYDGTYWVWVSMSYYYAYPLMAQSQANAGTATTAMSISPKVLNDTIVNKVYPLIYGLPPTTIAPAEGTTESLNDYTTPGVYTVPTATAAGRITESPVTTRGYRLEVKQYRSGTYYRQTIMLWGEPEAIYTRSRQGGTTWTSWYRFEGTSV